MEFKLLSALVNETLDLSLNDLTSVQRMMLKQIYTGKLDPEQANEQQDRVLDSLIDLGLLDIDYEISENGLEAVETMDAFSANQRADMKVAKELMSDEKIDTDFDDADDDDFDDLSDFDMPMGDKSSFSDEMRFTEKEEIAMKAANLNKEYIAELFRSLKEKDYPNDFIEDEYEDAESRAASEEWWKHDAAQQAASKQSLNYTTSDLDDCPECMGVGELDGEMCTMCNGEGAVFSDVDMFDQDADPDQFVNDDVFNDPMDVYDEYADEPVMDDEPFYPATDIQDERNVYRESAEEVFNRKWKKFTEGK